MKIKPHKKFENIFWLDNKICTKNLVKGKQVYGEKIIKIKNNEYRIWDPRRSKPSAAIYKKIQTFPIKSGTKILYLGIASGTTASHFSDIIGKKGIIYGIEISERVLRELLEVAEDRKNIVPILADAQTPEKYSWIEQVDVVYADVAMREQSDILIRNCEYFLKDDGYAIIAIKARSIDVTKSPTKIYNQQRKILERHFKVKEFVILDPYEKDHCMFILKKK